MKRNTSIFSSLILGLVLAACGPASNGSQQEGDDASADAQTLQKSNLVDEHSSRLALDWNGTYKGVLPCADCEGIETAITLYSTGKFKRTQKYLGKDDKLFVEEGEFEWNDQGSAVTITTEGGSTQRYQVGENILFHLDQEGNRITGDLAEKYQLKKNLADPRIENTKWILTELRGQEITIGEGNKEAYLILNAEDGRFNSNNSCNIMNGGYELKAGDRISFTQGMSTLMACPDMTIADAFGEVLERTDNYAVREGVLSLHRAKMAPLARFRKAEE